MVVTESISIVLAVYNGQQYLHEQIDSILAQKKVTIREIIVVNDCSTDASSIIIENYKLSNEIFKVVDNKRNQGPVISFKIGAAYATGEYIAFADQDDIWLDNKLESSLQLIRHLNCNERPAVVFNDLQLMSENGHNLGHSFWETYDINPKKNNFFTVLFANIVTGCTMMINKRMRAEMIAMPENVQMHDHWLALIGYSFGEIAYSFDCTIKYRVHSRSVTNKAKISFKAKLINFLKVATGFDKNFLVGEISQANLFKEKYQSRLIPSEINQLNYFIELGKASGMLKKINSKMRFLLSRFI